MTARRVFKWTIWAVAACCLLLVLAYLVVLFINRHDRAPSPAALRFQALSAQLPPVADKDNGFIYFMGFSVAPEIDPMNAGMQHMAWERQAGKAGQRPLAPQHARPYSVNKTRNAQINALLLKCQQVDLACARQLEANAPALQAWLQSEQWLVERYRSLLAFDQWRETQVRQPDSPEYSFAPLLDAQRSFLLGAWLRAGDGDAASVKRILEDDLRFWRRNLGEGDSLVTKLVAAAAVRRHFAWSNLILRRLPAAQAGAAIPAGWRLPVSAAERSMLRALAGESRLFTSTARFLDAAPPSVAPVGKKWMERLFVDAARPTFQLQATSNLHAERLEAIAAGVAVSYEALPAALRRMRALEAQQWQWRAADGVYNLLGNIVLSEATTQWIKYAAPVADLEGIRRATLLSAELRSQGVAPALVRERLKASPVRDPYDGRSFIWSDDAQAIVFAGLVEGERGRTVIPY